MIFSPIYMACLWFNIHVRIRARVRLDYIGVIFFFCFFVLI